MPRRFKSLAREGILLGSRVLRNLNYQVCSRWAVARRTMEDGNPYSLDDYPYIEEILNSRAKRNWIMKGAQTGLTEAAATISLFEVDVHKRDVIYFFPTGKMAERFSKTRFSAAISLSPYLRSRITRDDIEIKQIGTATLHILGANSEANLRGTSAGRLMFDELDAWTERQIYMAEERASGQKDGDKIVWAFSTPRFPNHGIHKQYAASTCEHYHFECPHCGEKIKLEWEQNFVLCGETVDDPRVHDSYIKCHHCDGVLDHATKREWLRAKTRGGTGEWIAENLDADPALSRGFHVSQLYSPTVEPFELAIAFLRGRGDEDARREFYNSKLGLPYIEDAHQVTDAHIDACVKEYALAAARPKSLQDGIVTLGIDQGGPVHHWVAVRWLFDRTREGDPNDRAIGKVVGCGRILQDDWDGISGLMPAYLVRKCVVDYFPEPTNARVFARKFGGDVVYLCQYVEGTAGREIRTLEDEYGANLCRVSKVSWLTKTLGRVMAGDLWLPADVPWELRDHLKAPIRTLKKGKDGYKAEYVEGGRPDHYAHALVYAEIALRILDPAMSPSDVITETRV